jgi:hypothetical protein
LPKVAASPQADGRTAGVQKVLADAKRPSRRGRQSVSVPTTLTAAPLMDGGHVASLLCPPYAAFLLPAPSRGRCRA